MQVGFIHIAWTRWTARTVLALTPIFLDAVRRAMPDVPLVQLTDDQSPALAGVDRIVRRPRGPFALFCAEHYAACEGEWLLLDVDVVVQRDVRDVFKDEFDVAIPDRVGTLVEGEEREQLIQLMPHNIGVVFSRSPAFWAAVVERLQSLEPRWREWMGNQLAACQLVAEGGFEVKILPGARYNFAPQDSQTDVREAAIVHYKGHVRKQWMVDRHRRRR